MKFDRRDSNRAYLFKRKERKAPQENVAKEKDTMFETVMNFLAFPEKHVSCPNPPSSTYVGRTSDDGRDDAVETSNSFDSSLSDERLKSEPSTLENMMDFIAEKRSSLPSMPEPFMSFGSDASGEKSGRIKFEEVMDTVAFPEKHIDFSSMNACTAHLNNGRALEMYQDKETYERVMRSMKSCTGPEIEGVSTTQATNRSNGNTFENLMDRVALPEKHLSCPVVS